MKVNRVCYIVFSTNKMERIHDLGYYLEILPKMIRSPKKGLKAPHKPILLLAVAGMIEKDAITENRITPNIFLISEFTTTWNRYVRELEKKSALSGENYPFQCNIVLPFIRLANDNKTSPFWHLVKSRQWVDRELKYKTQTKELQNDYSYAYLDNELFALLKDQNSRKFIVDCLEGMINS